MTDNNAQPDPAIEGILEPFVEEWASRARAQEAIDIILARGSGAPRVERVTHPRTGAPPEYVLVRRDTTETHAVTTRFSREEWDMISLCVLAQHGLTERGASPT